MQKKRILFPIDFYLNRPLKVYIFSRYYSKFVFCFVLLDITKIMIALIFVFDSSRLLGKTRCGDTDVEIGVYSI